MKRQLAALTLGAFLLAPAAHGVTLTLNNAPLNIGASPVYEDTTFVSLRALIQTLRPDSAIHWDGKQAVARFDEATLTAQPGDTSLVYNGERFPLDLPVRLEDGCTLVPIRPLAALFSADVTWNSLTGVVELTTAQADPHPDDAVYWLSRIISAESQGESWEGKIAVGNVVLNRVASTDFPDTIYGVIFDNRWGGQFEPVRNGTIYDPPTDESIQAAIACLNGANTAGNSLYFLAPALTDNHWTMENRIYVTTIGVHRFYE